ncbi:MAG: phosphatase PAP2 family protein [Actinobacteria bacterium]|nr:phosphatase PAP2 family protein [Actinomycetota bacterium]
MTLLGHHLHGTRARQDIAFAALPKLLLTASSVFVAVTAMAAVGWSSALDHAARLTAWLSNDMLDEVLKEVERPGQRVVVLPVLFALTTYLGWRRRRSLPWLAALFSVAFVNIMVGVVKWWSERATPRLGGSEFFNDNISRTFGAYPSGHATNVGMWATLAWFLVHDAQRRVRRAVRGAACGMSVVIAACSWLRTTHWLTDLIAGLALGCALATLGLMTAQLLDARLSRGRD